MLSCKTLNLSFGPLFHLLHVTHQTFHCFVLSLISRRFFGGVGPTLGGEFSSPPTTYTFTISCSAYCWHSDYDSSVKNTVSLLEKTTCLSPPYHFCYYNFTALYSCFRLKFSLSPEIWF